MLLFLILFPVIEIVIAKSRYSVQKSLFQSVCHDPPDLVGIIEAYDKSQLIQWFQESFVANPVEMIDEDWVPSVPEPEICKEFPKNHFEASVMQRALCPWQWRINHDENREPKFLSEAFCLCRKSRGNSGSFCMPIKREIAVLKKILCDPVTKRFEYIKSVQTITVGCHSVLPRSKHATSISAHYRLPQGDI